MKILFEDLFGKKKPGTYREAEPKKSDSGEEPPKKSGNGKKVIKHSKNAGIVVVLIVIAVLLSSNATYTINEQEQAVVTTFGVAHAVQESGLHFKIPFVQHVTKVDTTIQGFSVGYNSDNETTAEAVMITRDFNFVDIDFYVEYRVSDPVKAVFASEKPVEILKNMAQSCIRSVVSNYDVDSVLTTGKNEIQSKIKEQLMAQLEKRDIGLSLINITIQDSEPPTQAVLEAFKNVETAKQGKETSINNANKYRNEKLPQAEADVDRILQEAESTKTKRINEGYADVAMFNAQYTEYIKNPLITKQRMFYETMEDLLPNLKVIIDGTDSTKTVLMDQLSGTDLSAANAAAAAETETEAPQAQN